MYFYISHYFYTFLSLEFSVVRVLAIVQESDFIESQHFNPIIFNRERKSHKTAEVASSVLMNINP